MFKLQNILLESHRVESLESPEKHLGDARHALLPNPRFAPYVQLDRLVNGFDLTESRL